METSMFSNVHIYVLYAARNVLVANLLHNKYPSTQTTCLTGNTMFLLEWTGQPEDVRTMISYVKSFKVGQQVVLSIILISPRPVSSASSSAGSFQGGAQCLLSLVVAAVKGAGIRRKCWLVFHCAHWQCIADILAGSPSAIPSVSRIKARTTLVCQWIQFCTSDRNVSRRNAPQLGG